jgi:poly-gamma-glutamate synthesis protein (capsule biosynthesis protein)
LSSAIGDPSPRTVEVVPDDELLGQAWNSRPSWAIVPFDRLVPQWKVLRIDGQSVLYRDLDVSAYPLALKVGLEGRAEETDRLVQLLGRDVTNRDTTRISIVVMTGVTALARGTGMRMDRHGPTYPAEAIWSWLTEPDITHISSEVSFAQDCPPPTDYTTTVFCSNPSYIELLEGLDVDIIELTGNHLLDWGVEAMELSLTMYDERAIPYFGGGWNVAQAQSAVTITAGVHTFGFVGCNPAGPRSDWATEDRPGSAPCDYELLVRQIEGLRDQGIVPIVTLQYREAYQYEPLSQQRIDFALLAQAGAAIVSGSQAHQPQGFAFENDAFIHYGLGNLFFDQMWSFPTRQEFVDRHVFYAGRHISTEVLTAMLEDYAQPRPMSPEERESLLRVAFAASGW